MEKGGGIGPFEKCARCKKKGGGSRGRRGKFARGRAFSWGGGRSKTALREGVRLFSSDGFCLRKGGELLAKPPQAPGADFDQKGGLAIHMGGGRSDVLRREGTSAASAKEGNFNFQERGKERDVMLS